MTHYYFDLKNGSTERDHIGASFDNDEAAIARARIIADHTAARGAHRGSACHVSIVRDDGREITQVVVANGAEQTSAPRLKKSAQ